MAGEDPEQALKKLRYHVRRFLDAHKQLDEPKPEGKPELVEEWVSALDALETLTK